MNLLANISRHPGDPRVLRSGPSSLAVPDRVGRALGWFSIGLGVLELAAPRVITRTLGMRGQEMLVRGFGAREIAGGILCLSADQSAGLLSRVAGDGLDIATVVAADNWRNPRRRNARLALVGLFGITLVDIATTIAVRARHARGATSRDYSDRSGYPKGIDYARHAGKPSHAPTAFATAK